MLSIFQVKLHKLRTNASRSMGE